MFTPPQSPLFITTIALCHLITDSRKQSAYSKKPIVHRNEQFWRRWTWSKGHQAKSVSSSLNAPVALCHHGDLEDLTASFFLSVTLTNYLSVLAQSEARFLSITTVREPTLDLYILPTRPAYLGPHPSLRYIQNILTVHFR
jgi:hypothetical protein